MLRVFKRDVRLLIPRRSVSLSVTLRSPNSRVGMSQQYPTTTRSSVASREASPTKGFGDRRTFASEASQKTAADESNVEKEDGAPESPLAIVFTDIVESTSIWDTNAEVMTKAMELHDDLIRQLTRRHEGYEVKQNGDGFMIVFQTALSALKFCLEVQMQLQDLEWPQELLDMDPARTITEDGKEDAPVLWKGLRLRLSAHFGDPVRKWNEIISRWDYLGPPVNRSARYVSVCEGGQIIVSRELLVELDEDEATIKASGGPLFAGDLTFNPQRIEELVGTEFQIAVLGERKFKGIEEKQKLYVILPKSLSGRADYFPQHKYIPASKGNLTES